jgi:hypothetical protein
MQFWTKLVKQQNDLSSRVLQAGVIIMVVCFGIFSALSKRGHSSDLVYVGFLASLALTLIGWMLRRSRRVDPVVTDTDIIISIEEIRGGDQRFAVSGIEYPDFLVNSYHGMPGPRVRWRRTARSIPIPCF